MYCLDANVWVYFFDSGLDEHEQVRDPVAEILADEPVFVTTVLQMEVVHYLTNQLADSEPYVDRAATLLAEYDGTGIGGRDATVLAAMERHGVERLWTHDGGLKRLDDRLDWLTVTDPVE